MLSRPSRVQYASGVQAQPERKLVQRQRRAHAVTHCHQPPEKDRFRRIRPSQVEQPSVADKEQDQNAPHQVVNVHPAHRHPLHMPLVVRNPVHQQPHARKRNQERNRGNEHALPRPVRNRGANQVSQPRQLQQHQQHNDDQADERKQKRSAVFRHTLLKHLEASDVRFQVSVIAAVAPTLTHPGRRQLILR